MQVTGNNIKNNSKSIRFSTGGLSFCINGECKNFSFDKADENFHKSMAICLCDDTIINSDISIWDIYIDSPFYTIIPKEIGNRDICISAFKCNFPDLINNHNIMAEDIDRYDINCTFAINNGLYDFINTHFQLHRIHHYSTISLIKAMEEAKMNTTKQVWAVAKENLLYINVVDSGKLLLANSFNIKSNTDTLYFIGSMYEQYNLSQKETQLFFSGNDSHFCLLKKHISKCQKTSNLCEL